MNDVRNRSSCMIKDVIIPLEGAGRASHMNGPKGLVQTDGRCQCWNTAIVPALYAPTSKPPSASSSTLPPTSVIPTRDGRICAPWSTLPTGAAGESVTDILDIEPSARGRVYRAIATRLSRPSTKQHLAAMRMLFDWLVVGQVIATNPAAPVRVPTTGAQGQNAGPVTGGSSCFARLDFGRHLMGSRDRALIAP